MLGFGRLFGTFVAMMIAGYLAVVVLLPAPVVSTDRDDDGQSAAVRLSAEAQALVAHRPSGALQ